MWRSGREALGRRARDVDESEARGGGGKAPLSLRMVFSGRISEVGERQAPRLWFWTIPGVGAPIFEKVL